MSKHIATAVASLALWSIIIAQAATVPQSRPPAAKNDQRATTTPPGPQTTPTPAGGAVLCANNPFCLPPHLRQPSSTSGEAR